MEKGRSAVGHDEEIWFRWIHAYAELRNSHCELMETGACALFELQMIKRQRAHLQSVGPRWRRNKWDTRSDTEHKLDPRSLRCTAFKDFCQRKATIIKENSLMWHWGEFLSPSSALLFLKKKKLHTLVVPDLFILPITHRSSGSLNTLTLKVPYYTYFQIFILSVLNSSGAALHDWLSD